MERSDLYTGHNDYGKRATFDSAESGHYSTVGTSVDHEVFLHGLESEVSLLLQGLTVLRSHRELQAALSGETVNNVRIDTLIKGIETETPTKREEFIARHKKDYIEDKRPE